MFRYALADRPHPTPSCVCSTGRGTEGHSGTPTVFWGVSGDTFFFLTFGGRYTFIRRPHDASIRTRYGRNVMIPLVYYYTYAQTLLVYGE